MNINIFSLLRYVGSTSDEAEIAQPLSSDQVPKELQDSKNTNAEKTTENYWVSNFFGSIVKFPSNCFNSVKQKVYGTPEVSTVDTQENPIADDACPQQTLPESDSSYKESIVRFLRDSFNGVKEKFYEKPKEDTVDTQNNQITGDADPQQTLPKSSSSSQDNDTRDATKTAAAESGQTGSSQGSAVNPVVPGNNIEGGQSHSTNAIPTSAVSKPEKNGGLQILLVAIVFFFVSVLIISVVFFVMKAN